MDLAKKIEFTARQFYGGRPNYETVFSVVPFYYINFLLDQNPETIYDIGCGWNIFKKYIPNIIGIGAEDPASSIFYGDIHDFVDDEFIQGHKDYFESVFAINSLHNHPLSSFSKIVQDFYSMVKPNGRGFLALNFQRMIERDPRFVNADPASAELFCRTELAKLSEINFLVVDICSTPIDNYMDGNIRLVMEKSNT